MSRQSPNPWRVESFRLQAAEEAQRRRDSAARALAIRIGLALVLDGCAAQHIVTHFF